MLALFAAALVETQPSAKVDHFAQVDGRTYRIMVKGDEVRVFDKSAFWRKTLEERNRMRQAVIVATGCRLVDDYSAEMQAHLTGLLDCSKQEASDRASQ